ncbi:MAG TPA: DUF4337 family protein [Sphingomonas sp.]|nr:DUF4337 family protein [Sphingomonas sp.]
MDDDYDVRGWHEHVAEERARSGETLDQRIALFTAVLATLAAVTSFLGGHTQNEALLHKNEAVLIKAQASDAWGYYQAEALDRQSAAADAQSADALRPHTMLALAVTAIQVAIAIASITALTGRRWLLWVAGAAAVTGAVLAGLAWV